VTARVTGTAQPVGYGEYHAAAGDIPDEEVALYLRDSARDGIVESARPAGPPGRVVTVGGRDLVLASRHEALIWISAIEAYQVVEERMASAPAGGGD
jgi:hypothetical protein